MTSKYEDFTELIMTSYRAIQKIKSSGMKKIHLKAGDVNCIYYLSKYPEGLTNNGLADLAGIDKAAVSRSLNALIDTPYVTLSAEDDQKKYGKRYILTDRGKAVADGVNKTVDAVVEEVAKRISSEESTTFYKTFHSISEALVNLSEEQGEQ